MIKAFVLGKFLPFHKGHEAMISFALTKCDFLSILVCCDYVEEIPAEVRKNWIEATFIEKKNIEIRILQYDNQLLPNTSESSEIVSEIWSKELKKQYPDYDLLITSEPYGQLVAGYMGIKHLYYDLTRSINPISASKIRNSLLENWEFLPVAVRPYFAIKVVLLGTESTGKTTLTMQLSEHFRCSYVLEAGRELIEDSNNFTVDDLQLVAHTHTKMIEAAVMGDSPLVIIDTDIHITKSYANYTFDKELLVESPIYDSNKADLYLYLNHDAPYYQDGTRLSKTERDLLDVYHRQVLTNHQIKFEEISGGWQNRFDQAVNLVSNLISTKNQF